MSTYIRFCGLPVAGTLTGPAGTARFVKKKGGWMKDGAGK